MTTIKQTAQPTRILLKQAHCYSGGQRLEYALFGRSDGKWDWFSMEVKGFGEEARCEFSNDLSSALKLFDKLFEIQNYVIADDKPRSNTQKRNKQNEGNNGSPLFVILIAFLVSSELSQHISNILIKAFNQSLGFSYF